jgi:hypothetical protein
VAHCGLAIYIKWYLKAKEQLWKFKYFTMQKYNLQKNPLKETKIFQDIIYILIYNILGVCLSGGGRPPFHSSVLSSIHPSKFLIPEEEDDVKRRTNGSSSLSKCLCDLIL